MIAIMGVDSADVINKADSDTTDLRLIPNNRLKLESNELSFYKPLFNQDCSLKEEPDPSEYINKDELPSYFWDFIQACIASETFPTEEQLDPNNYYLKSSLPTFLNKFVAMALTKPDRITADTYEKTCQLLQATDSRISGNINQIFNWATSKYSNINGGLVNNIRKNNSTNTYLIQECTIISDKQINLRENKLIIQTEFWLSSYSNETQIIAVYSPVGNPQAPNNWLQIIKSGYKKFSIAGRTSTVSGYNFSADVDLTFSNGDPQSIAYNPITLNATLSPSSSTFSANISIEYYNNRNNGKILKESNYKSGDIKAIPSDIMQERIGWLRRQNANSSASTVYYAVSNLKSYKSTIRNINTNISEDITYIDYNKSKSIDDKLLTIV